MTPQVIALAFALHACIALASPASPGAKCAADLIPLQTDKGLVCGLKRLAEGGMEYASFRGVPYAKQPVGNLRFKELEPAEPWDVLNATEEGKICYQTDVLYGKIMNKTRYADQSESCIYANIHVPLNAPFQDLNTENDQNEARDNAGLRDMETLLMSTLGGRRLVRQLQPRFLKDATTPALPILVFIHGGGFAFGSGDTDLHGPEYLVNKKVIVITFNYRLNVFGFLGMNTTNIPGNAGLRDMVTLLNWVQRNAKYFGGDPADVTIAGQSAGAVAAHLLTLSNAAEGLFKRAILMSGTAASSFYSSSPAFAQFMSVQLLHYLNINSTNADDIHNQLIKLPAEKLCEANKAFLDSTGLTTFVPTVETPLPGVTTIIDDDPELLIAKGRGKSIPLLIGYTSAECETFRKRLQEFHLVDKIQRNSKLKVPPKTLMVTPPQFVTDLVKKIDEKYYKSGTSVDNFVKECSDGFYEYPALKLVQKRAETGGAEVFLYRFAYEGQSNIVKEATGLNYEGVGHLEDLTYVFKVNSILNAPGASQLSADDIKMKNRMTDFVVNFMKCSTPTCEQHHPVWPADNGHQFEDIQSPTLIQSREFSARQKEVIDFFDNLPNSNELQ